MYLFKTFLLILFNIEKNCFTVTHYITFTKFWQTFAICWQNYLNKKYYLSRMDAKELILQAYLQSRKKQLYFSQLQELTQLSHSSLQNVLEYFIEKKYLQKIKTKSLTFYHIKNKKYFALKFSEIALQKFQQLHFDIRIPLEEFLTKLPVDIYSVVLFGSTSQNMQHEQSDIDICIMSPRNINLSQLISKINARSNYPLSVIQTTPENFRKNEDHLLIQAKKSGFPINGEQFFYEVVLDEFEKTI